MTTRKGIRTRAWSRRERGSGTVLVAAAVAVLGSVLVAALALGSAMVASHRARAAADLAALAGAGRLLDGAGTPQACAAARSLARANGAVLLGCTPAAGGSLVVVVGVEPGIGGLGNAVARARAGPPGA